HGDAVPDLRRLLEAVRDVEDRHAFRLELANDAEQVLDLVPGQGRGRLVHDDDARGLRQCFCRLHFLLLTDTEAANGSPGVDLDAQTRERGLGLRILAPEVDAPQ